MQSKDEEVFNEGEGVTIQSSGEGDLNHVAITEEQSRSLCVICKKVPAEAGYEMAICASCRRSEVKYPIPLFIKILGTIVLGLMLFSLFNFGFETGNVLKYETAIKHIENKAYTQAEHVLTELVKVYPRSKKVLYQLLITHFKNENTEEFYRYLALISDVTKEGSDLTEDEVANINTMNDKLRRWYYPTDRVLDQINSGDKSAEETMKILMADYEQNANYPYNMYYYVSVALRDEDYEKAKVVAQKLVALEPDFKAAKVQLLNSLIDLKEYDSGESVFNTLMTEHSDYIDGFIYGARLYRHKGDLEKSLSIIKQADNIAPNHLYIYLQYLYIYDEMGSVEHRDKYYALVVNHKEAYDGLKEYIDETLKGDK